MAERQTRRSYPIIPRKFWSDLRLRWKQSPPTQVTVSYLETAFGLGRKNASNFMPQLGALGLIEDGRLTPLAHEWRLDESYPEARQKILDRVYPQELREAQPCDNIDPERLAAWFTRNTGTGEGAGHNMARLYTLICRGEDAGSREDAQTRTSGRAVPVRRSQKPRASTRQDQPSSGPTAIDARPHDGTASVTPRRHQVGGPSVHLDIQIHIAADTRAEQIDQIFESMARHLGLSQPNQ
jgi:Family of unknown function (DUF5343)